MALYRHSDTGLWHCICRHSALYKHSCIDMHSDTVQARWHCTVTLAMYMHSGMVWGTLALYNQAGTVKALRHCAETPAWYRHSGTIKILWHCTSTQALYRQSATVQALGHCKCTLALYRRSLALYRYSDTATFNARIESFFMNTILLFLININCLFI